MQHQRVSERCARLFQQNARIALISKSAAACEVNQNGAGDREQQKRDINIPASAQRSADHPRPALAAPCIAVGQRTGYAGDEHEYFRGIAEAVVPQRQPTSDAVGNVVKKNPPQRDASAGIYSQVTALAFQLRQVADQWLGRGNSIVHLVTPRCKNGPAARILVWACSHSVLKKRARPFRHH